MSLLDQATVFCINYGGIVEGCHFLKLVTCRQSVNTENENYSRRSRTFSLPTISNTSNVGDHDHDELRSCIPTPRIRCLSEELPPSSSPVYKPVLSKFCHQCIFNFTKINKKSVKPMGFAKKREKLKSMRKSSIPRIIMKSPGSKVHKSSHIQKNHGVQCSGTIFQVDGYMLSYFISEIKRSRVFRLAFLRHWTKPNVNQSSGPIQNMLVFLAVIKHPECEVLDLLGNKMVNSNIMFRRSLEHALSWLSTLGGAFSALGDLSPTYAEEAGHVSLTQLRIAVKLDDPGIQSRCCLFAAISLLQRGYLKSCRDIVRKEYQYAISLPEGSDPRLRRMCLGIWAKLQYHWRVIVQTDKKILKSRNAGLNDIRQNVKYWNVYNLEEKRKIMSSGDLKK